MINGYTYMMDMSKQPSFFSFLTFPTLIFSLGILLQTSSQSQLNHTAFIYKACSDGPSPGQPVDSVTFFNSLIAHSAQSKFFKTTTSAVSGLFQCRGDLSATDCGNCVRALPSVSATACGGAAAVRVQLAGCFMRYAADGFEEEPEGHQHHSQLLHKSCGGGAGGSGGAVLEAALPELENDVVESSAAGVYYVERVYGGGGVRVRAQCEVGLGMCECGECVGDAVGVAVEECGNALYGDIYMDKCILGFSFHLHVGGASSTNNNSNNNNNNNVPDEGGGRNIRRVGAIAAGVVAALLVGVVVLKFIIKSLGDKDDDF